MVDKKSFTETLHLVAKISGAAERPLSKEEIFSYFEGLELTEEQKDMVYQFFAKTKETGGKQPEPEKAASGRRKESESFRIYMEEIKGMKVLPKQEEAALYDSFLAGDRDAREQIILQWQPRLADLAREYGSLTEHIEDVVQEGNMGLLLALEELLRDERPAKGIEEYLISRIKRAMEGFLDSSIKEGDLENTVLAKVSLVHRAQKALAEELGRLPSEEELCAYTKLSAQETADILSLAKEKNRNF